MSDLSFKIESFESYHVGIKLNPAGSLDILASKLRERLGTERGYVVPKDTVSESRIRLIPPLETLATKNDVRIELNYIVGALNTIGTSPAEVSKTFADLPHYLIALGYELPAAVQYYEILATALIISDAKPADTLSKVVGRTIKGFDDLGPFNVTALRFSFEDPKKDSANLILEPSPTSPNSRLVLRVQYRSDDKGKIADFHQSINGRIEAFLASLR